VAADTYIRRVEPPSGSRRARPRRGGAFEPPEEFDDFVVGRRLGQGAIGQVDLGEDSVLARSVAIMFIGAGRVPLARVGRAQPGGAAGG